MSETLAFRLPLPPNAANARKHWAVKHKDSKAYAAACDLLQAGGIIPPPPKTPWAKATITAHLTLWNPMDVDNAVSRCKIACDWLVTRGYLVDDRAKYLAWGGMPTQRITRKNEPALELTLTRDA